MRSRSVSTPARTTKYSLRVRGRASCGGSGSLTQHSQYKQRSERLQDAHLTVQCCSRGRGPPQLLADTTRSEERAAVRQG